MREADAGFGGRRTGRWGLSDGFHCGPVWLATPSRCPARGGTTPSPLLIKLAARRRFQRQQFVQGRAKHFHGNNLSKATISTPPATYCGPAWLRLTGATPSPLLTALDKLHVAVSSLSTSSNNFHGSAKYLLLKRFRQQDRTNSGFVASSTFVETLRSAEEDICGAGVLSEPERCGLGRFFSRGVGGGAGRGEVVCFFSRGGGGRGEVVCS